MNNSMTTTINKLNNLNSNSYKVILNNSNSNINNSNYYNNNNIINNNNNNNKNNNNNNNNMIPSDQMKKSVSTPSCKILSNNNMETGVSEILETVLTYIVDDLKENEYLLLVSLYFADKYVNKAGVRQSQILWLILISCIVSFKMYSDSNKIQTKKIEKRFSIDIKDNIIGKIEVQFLSNIDYNLYIDEKTITSFITCLFIDYKINCQTNLDLIQSILSQIQSVIKTTD
ncbi:hypothetical protein ACTFIR_005306 [Dictyostelium discoideum]